MKEYTYTNKSYLGIKEGIVPPAPQYLWLNSKDDKLYKFGNSGWEVTPFSDVYRGNEFTVDDILGQITVPRPKLTISRAFLDAAYNGVLIMVRSDRDSNQWVHITVYRINNPNEETAIRFKVQWENIEYLVSCSYNEVLIGAMAVDAIITSRNLADWNENTPGITGYIANRTHYINHKTKDISIGDRVTLVRMKGTHYLGNYKVLYGGELYDIPPSMETGQTIDISGYFSLRFASYTEASSMSSFHLTSSPSTSELPYSTFTICGDFEGSGHKVLDEFYLPDGAKPWKTIDAIAHVKTGYYVFKDISSADIADGENVLRNKTIYEVNGGTIAITPNATNHLDEFKIIVHDRHNITIDGKCVWENGVKPNASDGEETIYSFLIIDGVAYASAKVYRIAK